MLTAAALLTAALGAADYTAAMPAPDLLPPAAPARPFARALSPARAAPALSLAHVLGPRPVAHEDAAAPPPAAPAPVAPAVDPAVDPAVEALTRQRLQVQRVHYALGLSTWGATLTTAALGTLVAINQPTSFGTGLCAAGPSNGVLGSFGCQDLGYLHEVSAFITASLYTATATYALSMFRLDDAGAVSHRSAVARSMHRGVALLHLAAMLLTPVLGIVAANPGLVGVTFDPGDPAGSSARIENFQANMRTAHLVVGYVLVGSLTTAMLLEF